MDTGIAIRLLATAGMLQAGDEPLTETQLSEVAEEAHTSVSEVRHTLEVLVATGLMLLPPEDDDDSGPLLLNAGSQFLELEGDVAVDVLDFLPQVIDDLAARRSLLYGGTVLVDEFADAISSGHGAEYAVDIVPPAFRAAVTDRLAVDLFAAGVALMARLTHGQPAACVAEEIMAVALMAQADSWLDMEADEGQIGPSQVEAARSEFHGIFELFQDDDVLHLFEMSEPSDAAVAGHTETARQLGVVDQRVEAWFRPFGGEIATGHLRERQTGDEER